MFHHLASARRGEIRGLRASARRGALLAFKLRALVLAVWLVPCLAFLPTLLVVRLGIAVRLEELRPAPGSLSDALLIVAEAVPKLATPILLAVLGGLLALWPWTVLWHAGVARSCRAGTGCPVRLTELLGAGLTGFWPYLRLSGTALLTATLGVGAIGVPLALAFGHAYEAMAEGAMVALVVLGLALAPVVVVVVWCATLGGAWRLAEAGQGSAVSAFLWALVRAVRGPLPCLGALATWALAGVFFGLLPLILGLALPALRGGPGAALVSAMAGVLRAFSTVALFTSFAPEGADNQASTSASARP